MPHDFDPMWLSSWKSRLFTIPYPVDSYALNVDSDGADWSYSDDLLRAEIPDPEGADILVVMASVPLQDNYHTRRISENIVVFTFYEVARILREEHIPIRNAVLRLLYSCCLVYRRSGGRVPPISEFTDYAHDETRGCLFDMTGMKDEIVVSCAQLAICPPCYERCNQERVSSTLLKEVRRELRRVRRPLFFRIAGAVEAHPIVAIVVSSIWAFLISAAASLVAIKLR